MDVIAILQKSVSSSRRWDKADLSAYYYRSGQLLSSICVPDDLLHTQCDGFQCTHWPRINDYYRSIVVLIQQATEERIPLIQHNSQKPYWCPELQELKKPPLMLIIYGNCVINLGLALLID